jgi:hypothetical protein
MQKRFQHAPEPESDIKTGRMIDENETTKVWIETCADELRKIRSKTTKSIAADLSIIADRISSAHWQAPKHRWN